MAEELQDGGGASLAVSNINIDHRERALIEWFVSNGIKINIVPLDIGDIVINNEPYKIILERKTYPDMIASIKDGRYKEQKSRLMASVGPTTKIGYILEGEQFPETNLKTFLGGWISTAFRDGIPIFNMSTVDETCQFIKRLGERCDSSLFMATTDKISCVYLENIKIKKASNIEPASWGYLALSTIPGVSITTARKILSIYGTLSNLMLEYGKLGDDVKKRQGLLANINISDDPNKTRKLGQVLSSRIAEFLIY